FVHLYRGGKDQYEGQIPEYRGRTELLKAGLTDGNIPLRILNIRHSDEGQYLCFVQDDTFYEETILELQVAGLGSAPLISVEGHQDGGIRVICQSAGWYPEPEMLWRDLNGRHLPSLSETTSRGDNNLFGIETALIVKKHSNQNLSCCIRNTVLNQEKESAVYIADSFFLRVTPWKVALSVILVGLFGFIGLAAYLFKMKDKRDNEINQSKAIFLKNGHSFSDKSLPVIPVLGYCHPVCGVNATSLDVCLENVFKAFLSASVFPFSFAKFTVIGPRDPVTTILGQEAVLPCHLSPPMSAANMEVRWFRSQFVSFVHLYRDGKDQYEGQIPEYQGRTELLKAGLTDGNVLLRILNIRHSDEGQYLCFVQDDTFYEETVLELQVAGLGSAPLISVEGHQDGGIRVVCRSAGWYPEPVVLWRDLSGRHLPSLSETKSRGDNNLFEIETALIVKKHSNQNLSCCIRNTILNQEKESAVYIADSLFPRVNPWMVALSVILMVLFGFIGLTAYLFKMKGKLTEEVGKRHTEIDKRDNEISLGSAPLISVEDHKDGGIRVVCRSSGWYPEPEVLWKDLSGRDLPSLSETTSRGDNNLFGIETALIVKKHSNQNLSCCIRNTILNQEKESAVYIADPFFPRVNSWMVALSVILVVLFGFIGLTVYLFKIKGKLTEEVGKQNLEIGKCHFPSSEKKDFIQNWIFMWECNESLVTGSDFSFCGGCSIPTLPSSPRPCPHSAPSPKVP
ncbi:hypothetical protein KIL84_004816, partial [Mauremys mutica]